jgi:hypothetical protein
VKPQLVRKRTVVTLPKTIKVVVQPSQAQVANLNHVKQARINRKSPQIGQPPPAPANAAVSQKGLRKRGLRQKTQVKYITASVSPESIAKAQSLRNTGKGKVLVIIGNGPSILEVPLEKLKNHPKIDTLSINKPDERLWPTTHWAFFDGSQMRRHEALWTLYGGNIFNSTAIKKQKQKSIQFKNIGGKGFSRDVDKGIHIGRSSVFASMQIGMWMGYEHIYIFGVDMNPEGMNGKLHFYGDNPDVEPDIRRKRFKDEAVHYDHAAAILTPAERSLFTFCTLGINPWDFVKEFNQMGHREAVAHILEHVTHV